MITIENLHKSYAIGDNSIEVLKGLNLNIEEGELVSLMGSSGSGKSTLLNILGFLDTADGGNYFLDDIDITTIAQEDVPYYRNKYIGFIFQSFNLINYKNTLDNVALPLYYRGVSKKERNALALKYLDKVGLKGWAFHMPNQLSGGQKQRVAIARAMVTNPKLLLADEPTGALDTKTSMDIMNLIKNINAQGTTVLIVTHELDIARRTNRIIHFKDGKILNNEFLLAV